MREQTYVARIRREAKQLGYLLRKNRSRDPNADNYGLYVLIDDIPDNRAAGVAAARFAEGAGTPLGEVAELLNRAALHDEALYQGLRLIGREDTGWRFVSLSSEEDAAYCPDMSAAYDFLFQEEHCVRCLAEHADECHAGRCAWSLVHDYLVCPQCLTETELQMRGLTR